MWLLLLIGQFGLNQNSDCQGLPVRYLDHGKQGLTLGALLASRGACHRQIPALFRRSPIYDV